jgi:hypothetical protein
MFAKTTLVVVLYDQEGKLTLVLDPGLGRPWSTKNEKQAKWMADQVGGEAHTWESAFKLLLKAHPNFEDDLIDRIRRRTTLNVPRDANRGGPPIVDQGGNPL